MAKKLRDTIEPHRGVVETVKWTPAVGAETPEAAAHKAMVASWCEVRVFVDAGGHLLDALQWALEQGDETMLGAIRKIGPEYMASQGRAAEAAQAEKALAAVDAIRVKAASDCIAAVEKVRGNHAGIH